MSFVTSSSVYIANKNMRRNVSSNCKNAANYTKIETAKICGNVSITVPQYSVAPLQHLPDTKETVMTNDTKCIVY